jgi:hypothetical protein
MERDGLVHVGAHFTSRRTTALQFSQ